MKKVIGKILFFVGGFLCVVNALCTPLAFTGDDNTFGERIILLFLFLGMAAFNGLICWLGFRLQAGKRTNTGNKATGAAEKQKTSGKWMTSQLPALYLQSEKKSDRDDYLERLTSLGFTERDAKKLFDFEADIIRKFPKQYLLDSKFTNMWFFSLKQPFFQQYPKTKEDILKERFLTVSELCKIIDEAEWHFWNSHEKALPDGVWSEICAWRLKGPGAEFAIRYFKMIEEVTGIPEESLAKLSSEQGKHLSQYKWR